MFCASRGWSAEGTRGAALTRGRRGGGGRSGRGKRPAWGVSCRDGGAGPGAGRGCRQLSCPICVYTAPESGGGEGGGACGGGGRGMLPSRREGLPRHRIPLGLPPVFLQAPLLGAVPPGLAVTWIGCDRGVNCTKCPKHQMRSCPLAWSAAGLKCAPGMRLISTLASLVHLERPSF